LNGNKSQQQTGPGLLVGTIDTGPDRFLGGGPTMTGPVAPDTGPTPVDTPVKTSDIPQESYPFLGFRSGLSVRWSLRPFSYTILKNNTGPLHHDASLAL
jgi:hypothetical protein